MLDDELEELDRLSNYLLDLSFSIKRMGIERKNCEKEISDKTTALLNSIIVEFNLHVGEYVCSCKSFNDWVDSQEGWVRSYQEEVKQANSLKLEELIIVRDFSQFVCEVSYYNREALSRRINIPLAIYLEMRQTYMARMGL